MSLPIILPVSGNKRKKEEEKKTRKKRKHCPLTMTPPACWNIPDQVVFGALAWACLDVEKRKKALKICYTSVTLLKCIYMAENWKFSDCQNTERAGFRGCNSRGGMQKQFPI